MPSDRPRTHRGASAAAWPAITYESLSWKNEHELIGSRRERAKHAGRYRAAVVPAIADAAVQLSSELLSSVAEASSEVSRFDELMGGEIAQFSAILLRSESAASSRIENLTASARAIGEAELGDARRSNAAEIVANTRTMTAALALAGKIDEASILAMHRALMESTHPEDAGRWRREQVWIGGRHLGPHEADFVPPQHASVPEAIKDLLRFVARDDMAVLVHAALAHAHFETIHPFTDGNGRTGRALLQAMLRGGGLTRNVTVPVSGGLLADTSAYFDALTAYRAGDIVSIVSQFVQAAFRAVANGKELVFQLRDIKESWKGNLQARRDSAVWRVVDLLLRRPVINARVVESELEIPVGNVHRYVQPLLDAGVLVQSSDARRNQIWRAPAVLSALDAFAARAGRRVSG